MPSASRASAVALLPADAGRRAITGAVALIVGGLLYATAWPDSGDVVADRYWTQQDRGVLMAFAGFLLIGLKWPARSSEMRWGRGFGIWRHRVVIFLVAVAALFAAAGSRWLLWGFAFSRDEAMAEFDASIFAGGHLVAPIDAAWRPFADALGVFSTFVATDHSAWVSRYLPVNAALRAAAMHMGDAAIANATLSAVALVCTHHVARRLWPARPDAAMLALLMLVLSPQFLLTATTPYAMTAHLAFNMLWLVLFLRGGVAGHAGAIGVGALATGLHQFVFHPLFAAPFVLQLLTQRRYREGLCYVAAYALIGLFWTQYFRLLSDFEGFGGGAPRDVWRLALELLGNLDGGAVRAMVRNILRFVGWQPLVWAPLFVAGCGALRGADPLLRALALAMALSVGAALLLMPYQGYGWGYRYLHGLLGAGALLAASGWIALTQGWTANARTGIATSLWTRRLGCGLALSLAVLPLRIGQARDFVAPYAHAARAISAADADVVIVDPSGYRMAFDLVRNDPLLQRRPIVLDATFIPPALLAQLCAGFRVQLFGAQQARAFGIPAHASEPEALPLAAAVVAQLHALSCDAPVQTGLAP